MKRILIVEDHQLNRDMLRRRLDCLGYDTLIAADGAQAVEIARQEGPDLILMDLNLPVMDGWTATRAIRKCNKTSSIPIIALTAHVEEFDRNHALEAGCDDYITKPINMNRLIAAMEALTVSV